MKMFEPPLNPNYPTIPFLVAMTICSVDLNDHYAEQYFDEKKVCADLLAKGGIA